MRGIIASVLVLSGATQALAQLDAPDAQVELQIARQTLQEAKIEPAAAALVHFFQQRTLSAQEQTELAALVEQLGHPSYTTRMRAQQRLQKAGQSALPFLQEGLKAADAEIVRRAELCLQYLRDNPEANLVSAAALVLADEHPPEAARVLVAYLPFAASEEVIHTLRKSLRPLALRQAEGEPALLAALTDRFAVRRTVAAEVLAEYPQLQAHVEPLLRDPDLQVRLAAALALCQHKGETAVPVLIALLDQLPADQSAEAEEMLRRLAGEEAPPLLVRETTPAQRQQAWQQWWQALSDEQQQTQLTKLAESPPFLNYTLIAQMHQRGTRGQVLELGPTGLPRWSIGDLTYPVDAQVLGHNRVLIAEYLGRRVTERNFQGEILWSRQVDLPVACQRLPDGNTFIACRRQLLIVTRDGKDVFTFQPQTSITAASRLSNGDLALITAGGEFQRINAKGEVVQTFMAGQVYTLGGNLQVLANGRILVPQYRDNKVVEYSPDGKVQWSAAVTSPTSAVRLPNGHTLVVSMMQQRIVEIDRQGQEVWSYRTEGRPWRARRR
jgi:hypothetical protein